MHYYSQSAGCLTLIALVLALCVYPSSSAAQISPDRPGFGNGSTALMSGRFQVESGYGYSTSGNFSSHSVGQILLRYGLTSWLELRGGIGSYVVNETPLSNGYEGTSIGGKVGLLEGPGLSMGLLATTGLPTGTGLYESNDVWQDLTLVASMPVAGPTSLATNVGHQFTFGEGLDGESTLTTTLLVSLSETVGLGLGYAGFYTQAVNRNYLEGGATYRTSQNTQLDVNWAYQIDSYQDQILLGFGIAHRF